MSSLSINLANQTELRMELYRSDVIGLTETVFLSMLGMQVHPAGLESLPGELITGAVHFSGPWKGVAILQCTAAQACEFATRLIGVQCSEFGEDTRSAMEELTNILGGNLKPLLPPGVEMSMPTVTEGGLPELTGTGKNSLIKLVFTGTAGAFSFSVISLLD